MRFRKSISICKGVKLNFSKSGVSATVGGKGISANVGKQGVYLNTSLPGTGIYDRKRLVNFNNIDALGNLSIGGLNVSEVLGIKKPAAKASSKRPANAATEIPEDFQLEMAEDGSISVYDGDGMRIGDTAVLNKIKNTASYRKMVEEMVKQQLDAFNAETEAFVNIGQLAPDVLRANEFERALRESRPETAPIAPFPDPEPTREGIYAWLEAEAKKSVTGFFNVEKKREDYVRTHLAEAYAQEHEAWEARKAEYEEEQRAAMAEENERLAEEHERRMEMLRAGLEGSEEAVEGAIEDWLHSLELPIDFDVDFEYNAETGVLMADMDLPEIEDLPTEKMVEMSSGKLRTKEKTQKELRQEYTRCVFGLGVFCAANFFNCAPAMQRILLSGYTQRRDGKTGERKDTYIYSVIFDRAAFERAGFQKKEPEDFVNKFKSRVNMNASGELKEIEPYTEEDLA